DTHAFYSELVESGLAEKTAEALTKAVTKIETAKLEELATKRDLKEIELKIELVKSELKRDIETVRKEMAENKAELIRWVVGVGMLQITVITALILKLTAHI
ncbi:MAG: CCDC90 family protein, partial [Methylococcaceae bacterium]|nr:CCDC90 family protein [Methylococcaceae bacterium]